ncbi:drug/metabolite transporter (DMT)-like permease [Paenibacillus endophyticus]|uniref:Drug/metabolite transporter (DMT)-like permease n=1 Tax=Paenibacillus endophyticus TaxID=1294268 RepID=A0A7W5G9M5_9BACL|nr:DMT family transporter [Paenibacillus endophyticus]MBB3151855.1 drug/metabolite transporter (DMT)-like permease [Paenibacillus endophyticus]
MEVEKKNNMVLDENFKLNGVRLAYLLAVINAVIIGISFLVVKKSLDYSSPFDTLTFRFAAAFLILIVSVALGIIKLNYRGKPLYKLLLLATMYPIGFFTFQTFGLQHATSAEGGIINAVTPVITMLFASVFLKEATTLSQKWFTLVSVSGVVFIFMMKGSNIDLSKMSGILLLLMASIVFAGYSVLARSISQHYSTTEISFFMVGIGFMSTSLITLVGHSVNDSLGSLLAPLSNGAFVLLILCLGTVQLSTALMGNFILSKLQASKAGVFINLSTVVSIAGSTFVLGEDLAWYHICGSFLIIIGVIGANLLGRKRFTQKTKAVNHANAV